MQKHYERIIRNGRNHNDVAIVFVHGVLGSFQDTWGMFPFLVTQDSAFYGCDIICWGYPSTLRIPRLSSIPFLGSRTPELHKVADALSSDLANPEIGGDYRNLILVGHSMGGLVIKKMILSALTRVPEDSALVERVRRVVLYATPCNGVQLPTILKVHAQAKSIACTSEFITTLRSEWINRVYRTRPEDSPETGKCYIPVTVVIGLEDNAVSAQSAASYFTDLHTAAGNHTEVCKPSTREHTSFQVLKRVVQSLTKSDVNDVVSASPAPVTTLPAPSRSETEMGEKQSGFSEAIKEADKGNFKKAYSLLEAEAGTGAKRLSRLAFACFHLYEKGWLEGFSRLRQIANENPSVAEAFLWLGMAYLQAKQWPEAAECFRKQRDLAQSISERVSRTARMADALVSAGKGEEALTELRCVLHEAHDPPDVAQAYKALGDIFLRVRHSDPLLAIACYEKSLASNPNNDELRFDLGYKHNSTIGTATSFYHYRKILEHKNDAYACNNAGVDAQTLNLPLNRIDYFERAAKEKLTLAMANIGKALIDAGCERMAKEVLDNARREEIVHDSVDQHLGYLKERRQAESETIEKLDANVKRIIEWRWQEAEAASKTGNPNKLLPVYRQSDGSILRLTTKGDGTVIGECKGEHEAVILLGRLEGMLLRFSWNTTPVDSGNDRSSTRTGLLSSIFRTNNPSSGIGSLIIDECHNALIGYKVHENQPLEPIEWQLFTVED